MRNHRLVHDIVDKMILYNHPLYIQDVNGLIQLRQFNNNINYYLGQIVIILGYLLQTQTQNLFNAQNPNVQSLKTCIYGILDNEGGGECCNKLLCTNQ